MARVAGIRAAEDRVLQQHVHTVRQGVEPEMGLVEDDWPVLAAYAAFTLDDRSPKPTHTFTAFFSTLCGLRRLFIHTSASGKKESCGQESYSSSAD